MFFDHSIIIGTNLSYLHKLFLLIFEEFLLADFLDSTIHNIFKYNSSYIVQSNILRKIFVHSNITSNSTELLITELEGIK